MESVLNILDSLQINHSFFIHFIIFSVTFFILKKIVFSPLSKIAKERESKTLGDKEKAIKFKEDLQKNTNKYDELLAESRKKARLVYEGIINEANEEKGKIVLDARNNAHKVNQEIKKKIQNEVAQATAKVYNDINVLAKEVLDKILGRSI